MERTCFLTLTLLPCSLHAADYYVSHVRGDDKAAGTEAAPFRRIARAVKQVKPGDTVHLVPSD